MFKKKILDNGIIVLLQNIPYVSSVSLGFTVKMGSRFEPISALGYSHFVEHMLFKGTHKRSAKDIAREVDKMGANINAATNREYTMYYIHAMSDYLNNSMDILVDMLKNSIFDKQELEREKTVILEEVKMYEDSPSEHVYDIFLKSFIPNQELGRPVIGTVDSIKQCTRKNLIDFYNGFYGHNKLILSVAGNLETDAFLKDWEKLNVFQSDIIKPNQTKKVQYHYGSDFLDKDISQVNFVLGFPGIKANHKLRYALYILNTLIGGGMSSILFQEVREKKGLCYSIYSNPVSYADTGMFLVSSSTNPEMSYEAFATILDICKTIRDKGFTDTEIEETKNQIKGQMALASENVEYLMNRMAAQERVYGEYFSIQDTFAKIDAVSPQEVRELIDIIFTDDLKYHFASVGPKDHFKSVEKLVM